MGLFSSSRKSTDVTNVSTQETDQSFREYNDSYNNYLDNGAISTAFDFSNDVVNRSLGLTGDTTEQAFDFSSDVVNKALDSVNSSVSQVVSKTVGDVVKMADDSLTFAADVTRNATNPDSETLKYGLIAAGLIAAAMVLKK